MKKAIFIYLFTLVGFAQSKYTIIGNLTHISDGPAKLYTHDIYGNNRDLVNEGAIKKGILELKGESPEHPLLASLQLNEDMLIELFIEEGTINIIADGNVTIRANTRERLLKAKINGTPNNDVKTLYEDRIHALSTSETFIDYYKNLNGQTKSTNEELEHLYNNVFPKFKQEVYDIKKDFIKDNLNCAYTLLLINEECTFMSSFTDQEIETFFLSLNKSLETHPYYKTVREYISIIKPLMIGAIAPNFKVKDINDKDITLSSYRGNYVLLDFWAYWCKPCIKEFPHLEELRKKYKAESFEVFGIHADPNKQKWLDAIKIHAPTGVQGFEVDPKAKNSVSGLYNVIALPTVYLLNPEGKIVGKHFKDDELDEKLKQIFEK
ncbi:TlpA disulfide reductase family protein [Flavivirga rizhaonensis]|uniref:Redoxin domain-containing protein n=1 Tax=Flavivirga rizhaonensis TaxID=2559571 RepID=A0A4S1DVU2_9FLAO|nr:TlpA disulfide reductase family protein [Flavivirga rizhaonensis]TGV02119.1 redoxin domain-containing protein [Flavivirga rizhaonensis]